MIRNKYIKMLRPRNLILVLMTALFLSASPAFGLKVTGVILEGQGAPGEHVSFDMGVSLSNGENANNLSVQIVDWKQSLEGQNQAAETNSAQYSAKNFITVSPKSFHLGRNGSQSLVVEGTIPADAKPGGRYAIVSVTTAPEEVKGRSNVGTAVAINSLVRIIVTGPGISKTGEITNLTVTKPVSSEYQNASLIFNNTGNIHYQVLAAADLKDKDGRVLANATTPLTSNINPEAARLIEFSFNPESELKQGVYSVNATISLDDGTILATKDAQFEMNNK